MSTRKSTGKAAAKKTTPRKKAGEKTVAKKPASKSAKKTVKKAVKKAVGPPAKKVVPKAAAKTKKAGGSRQPPLPRKKYIVSLTDDVLSLDKKIEITGPTTIVLTLAPELEGAVFQAQALAEKDHPGFRFIDTPDQGNFGPAQRVGKRTVEIVDNYTQHPSEWKFALAVMYQGLIRHTQPPGRPVKDPIIINR